MTDHRNDLVARVAAFHRPYSIRRDCFLFTLHRKARIQDDAERYEEYLGRTEKKKRRA